MGKRSRDGESRVGPPFRMPGDTQPLPRIPLGDFNAAQRDPEVKQALREAEEEGLRLKREGLLRD